MKKVAAVLLAGGLATRMGGGDKGLKLVAGKPILDHVIERVGPQVDKLILNANGEPARFAGYGLDVVADPIDGFVGPLAGVLAAMDALAGEYDYILSVPTDTPFLPDDLLKRLSAPIQNGQAQITMARSGGYDHPVIALWPVCLREDLRHALQVEGVRKLKQWISRYPHQSVEWSITKTDPFFNANRPEDLEKL